MPIMSIVKFEHFFRAAASLDVDKADLMRFSEFINHNVHGLLVRGEAIAQANGRDLIEPHDLPITKGLRERIHMLICICHDIELKPILDELTMRPPLNLDYSHETETQLPAIAGGLSMALARSFKIIDENVKNPSSEQWERSYRIFDLLL